VNPTPGAPACGSSGLRCGSVLALLATGIGWGAPAEGLASVAESTAPTAASEIERGTATAVASPGLAVSTEATGPEGEMLREWVEERAQSILEEREEPLGPEDRIRVTVRGSTYDYRIQLELVRHDRPLDDQPAELVCECGSDEMLERVGEAIGAGAEQLLQAERAEQAAARQAAAERAKSVRERDGDASREIGGAPLGPLGYAGIGVGILGAVALGVGLPLVMRTDEPRGIPPTLQRYSTHSPGIALAIGGGGALATGVALIIVDRVRHRQRSLAVLPTFGPGRVGLSITRSF
jgi:hypothetical protein